MSTTGRARGGLMHRLAVYAIGVAIGLMLVGLLQKARMASHARQTGAMEATEPVETSAAGGASGADEQGFTDGASGDADAGVDAASEGAVPSNSP